MIVSWTMMRIDAAQETHRHVRARENRDDGSAHDDRGFHLRGHRER